MNNTLEKAFQLFGLDKTASELEVRASFRKLSAHAHPDRFERGTNDYAEALAKQKRLNCARDLILEHFRREAQIKKEQAFQQEGEAENYEVADRPGGEPFQEKETKEAGNEIQKPTDFINIRHKFSQGNLTAEGNDAAALTIFLALIFIGVGAASIVSAVLPFLATGAPLVIILVMLGSMAFAAKKLRDLCVR